MFELQRYMQKGCPSYDEQPFFKLKSGNFRIFHAVSSVVHRAFESLTSVFGMGTGGSSQLSPPENFICALGGTLKTAYREKRSKRINKNPKGDLDQALGLLVPVS